MLAGGGYAPADRVKRAAEAARRPAQRAEMRLARVTRPRDSGDGGGVFAVLMGGSN